MSSTSGRWANHSLFNWSSAAVRVTLSGDWSPLKTLDSAVCTFSGSEAMVGGKQQGGRKEGREGGRVLAVELCCAASGREPAACRDECGAVCAVTAG